MKISQDVMVVLSTIETKGLEVRITEQLDRKFYTKTNKVLEALGGKWNRRAKAHIFPSDASVLIEGAILTGEVTTAKDIGFFPTPLEIGRLLVSMADLRPGLVVLEPSAGRGDLIEAIREHLPAIRRPVSVIAIEREKVLADEIRKRFPQGVGVHTRDFLDGTNPDVLVDRVIMNPPFIRENGLDHLDHVRAAHDLLRGGGILVSVLPKSVDFREDRRHRRFREWFKGHGGLTVDLPERAFAPSGTNVCTVALVMSKGRRS